MKLGTNSQLVAFSFVDSEEDDDETTTAAFPLTPLSDAPTSTPPALLGWNSGAVGFIAGFVPGAIGSVWGGARGGCALGALA